jgi:glucose/arabinose dehydrogenase/mono/diheme cytochrome c family protein
MPKKSILVLIFLIAAVAAYQFLLKAPDGFEAEEGYTALYNGENLEGWRVVGGESTFTADGESIVGHHGPGKNTFLRTGKTFGDFSLKMQMRWDELGNSGVMFRAQQREGNGRVYGYQYELDHSDRAWSGGIYDEARRGWLAPLDENEEARQAIRLDDWNDVEIEARGASLKTWINGVLAGDIVDGLNVEGFIALQVHSGNAGIIRWRHIRIAELDPVAQQGQALDQAEDWRTKDLSEASFFASGFTVVSGEGKPMLASRRRLNDAIVHMTVPACDEPTTIRMRYSRENNTFAEVSLYADRAESRLVNGDGETIVNPVELVPNDQHLFTGVTVGPAVALTVNERDLLRVANAGLDDRGELAIVPADCGSPFTVDDFAWFDLKEKRDEVEFYKTLDNKPALVLSPQEALTAFKVAPGFEVELVAAEPLVEDPVAMAWDEYGRLYVVEMRGYMPDAYGSGSEEPVGQVVRLEDQDGDGQMDRSEVFLGGLVNPRAVAIVNEGILIGEPPNLWLCELPSRAALCDKKHSVGSYAPDVGNANVEHMENRLLQGLDNWLYNSKSSRRLKLVNGELIEQQGLFRGQWGISKDDHGRLFYNHNSTWVQADLFAAEDLVITGETSYPEGLGVNLTEDSPVYSVRVNPGVNRAYLQGTLREDGRLARTTGASGLAVYRGDQFPEGLNSHIFVPESAGNVVAQFALVEDGMALSVEQQLYNDDNWGQRDFLGSTDERFRPVDAANGPDGALYIIDMYRGIIQDDHYLTDELREQIFERKLDKPVGKGRIWRVRHTGGKSGRDFPVLGEATDKQLVGYLSHPNGLLRDTAQRLLLASEGELDGELAELATADQTLAGIHALWTLEGRGELTAGTVLRAVATRDEKRQVQALRAGGGLLQPIDLARLYRELDDAPESVRVQLAFAMADHRNAAVVQEALREMLASGMGSVYLRQAVVRAVRGVEMQFLQEMFASGKFDGESEAAIEALSALAAGAYRSLRGDLESDMPANPALLDLLALTQSRQGSQAWQQIAMLDGFKQLSLLGGFLPAELESAPPMFSASDVKEEDLLWSARLAGRRAFTWPGDELALGLTPLSPRQLELVEKGKAFYKQCAACHGASGAGVTGLAPALAGASWVVGPPEWLGRIILQGMSGPIEINGESWDGVMPPHGQMSELDDATLAGLMTHVRRNWGNRASTVSEEAVAAIRAASAKRKRSWTAAELEAVPFDRGYKRFVGKYSVSFITMTISEEADGLHMNVPMYGGGLMTPISEFLFEGAAGDEKVRVEFVADEDGQVNKFILHRQGEKIPVTRKAG